MQLTIDNLDGLGAVDYSAAIDRSAPITITRALNAPTLTRGTLCLEATALARPSRQARVVITADSGTILFTGYLPSEPVAVYAGVASAGPVYRLAFNAVSDEWLLDKQAAGATFGSTFQGFGTTLLASLATRVDAARLATAGLSGGRTVGVFEPQRDGSWSTHAGAAGNASYSAYRALDGALNLTPAGDVIHTFQEGEGTLSVAALRTSAVRELANDVTVSGALEPTVFWTELFAGDGTTSVFLLSGDPAAPAGGHATLVEDSFSGSTFERQRWAVVDPGSHLSLGAATNTGSGLVMTGGNGFDGQTTLTANDSVELAGTVVFELGSVALAGASAGYLGGLYTGAIAVADCFAGWSVSQSGGSIVLSPLINGAVTGTPFPVLSGHTYTLRLRLHCAELQRVKQKFYAMVDGTVQQFGGGLTGAPVALVFEVRDLGNSSNTPATILYDGAVANCPAQARFVAVNSVQLFGSLGRVSVERTGSAWVRSADPTTGTVSTRLMGGPADGVDCGISSFVTGAVTFFPGRTPIPGQYVTVSYRGRSRAVARLADAASMAREAEGGGVGTARWIGKVVRPVARSSEDCENAAQAILSFSTNRAAAVTGDYVATNPTASSADAAADIWPGDLLALTRDGLTISVIVRRVEIQDVGAAPEALTYHIAFANDWAEGLGITLSEAIAADALPPGTALDLAPGTSAPVLANLQQMTATPTGSGSSLALTVDAGIDPPTGGGFEVRRRDRDFGPGAAPGGSSDLVLRSPVRGFVIPRAAVEETFFVRMYDVSTPPLYSRWSSAIATHLPLS